jgi:hypothetical protein
MNIRYLERLISAFAYEKYMARFMDVAKNIMVFYKLWLDS